ncbi:putative feruloyl esterase [Fulvia fulva]|uniref:Carboxylic ester hydrolase n=1 Tax=Passalora fulva TaxID=5499 RepID=A0A9Q8PCG3_PASFU|nr:putative feruloyl esterase [Fulvia fulva]UJO19847.1 putative feruloyl esterase [Fulvia fulva]
MKHKLTLTAIVCSALTLAAAKQTPCSANNIKTPEYFGLEVLNIQAQEVKDYNEWGIMAPMFQIASEPKPVTFCNVTVTYTHPGTNDNVNVCIALPTSDWNERFIALGGGGLSGGFSEAHIAGLAAGYATALTDSGHSMDPVNASSWALKSPGNIDWQLLQDNGYLTLDDMTAISKQVVSSFYGKPAKYSYWNGCSNGGRQGLVQAQRYPKNYDGILAAAPAIDWASFTVGMHWAHVQMIKHDYVPAACELAAVHELVIEACDELDGVKDGVISAPGLCHFDAKDAVGRKCCSSKSTITKKTADIVNAVWAGAEQDGQARRPGQGRDMPFGPEQQEAIGTGGLAQTWCEDGKCRQIPFMISAQWLQYFIAKDPDYNPLKMSEDEFFNFLRRSSQEYGSVMNADWTDLSEFKAAGGKMITWHGLADELLLPNTTAQYYDQVLEQDPSARDYYRYFEAPGVGHCFGGPGYYPGNVWDSLVDWVEKGKAPEELEGASPAGASRPICQYPKVARYVGGDAKDASSFECAEDFGTKKADANGKDEL